MKFVEMGAPNVIMKQAKPRRTGSQISGPACMPTSFMISCDNQSQAKFKATTNDYTYMFVSLCHKTALSYSLYSAVSNLKLSAPTDCKCPHFLPFPHHPNNWSIFWQLVLIIELDNNCMWGYKRNTLASFIICAVMKNRTWWQLVTTLIWILSRLQLRKTIRV